MDILLVDDEEGIRKVLGLSLTDRGYRVHTASGGQQALELFEQVKPSIVLTDIKMPGMDGIDLLKAIKAIQTDVEVIMVTGHGDVDLAIKSLQFDATDFITKPIDDDILDVALKRARERIDMRAQIKAYTENLEQLVAEKSSRLVQAERLAAMGETVAGLAHAIKNIVGGLRGGAWIVYKVFELESTQYLREGWQMVSDNVRRIQQLSLDLLNIAKPAAPKYQTVDPNAPLVAVHELLRPQADELGAALIIDKETDPAPVRMETESIHRCLLNLVGNALDACGQARGAASRPGLVIRMSAARADGMLEYRVSDTCGGVDPTIRERLFQGFFTTKGSRGTGIGLMLSRKIVESHGGTITYQPEPDGSTFIIRLPL